MDLLYNQLKGYILIHYCNMGNFPNWSLVLQQIYYEWFENITSTKFDIDLYYSVGVLGTLSLWGENWILLYNKRWNLFFSSLHGPLLMNQLIISIRILPNHLQLPTWNHLCLPYRTISLSNYWLFIYFLQWKAKGIPRVIMKVHPYS